MVVSGFFRNFAVHLRKMHAQADSTRSMRGEYQRRERYGPDILRWATEGKRSGHRKTDGMHCKLSPHLKNRLAEALIAALTAFVTALTMVSCMGFIPAF